MARHADREIGAIGLAGRRVQVHRPGRAEARARVVDADDEETLGVQRLAGADQVVPPAFATGGVETGHVMARVQRVADEHGVALVGVQRAVGLVGELVAGERGTALQRQRRAEMHLLCGDGAERSHGLFSGI